MWWLNCLWINICKVSEFLPLITVTTDTLQVSLASLHISSYFVTLFTSFNIFLRLEFIIYLDTLYSNRSRKVFRKSFMNAKRRSTVNCWWYLQLQPLIEERLCTMSSFLGTCKILQLAKGQWWQQSHLSVHPPKIDQESNRKVPKVTFPTYTKHSENISERSRFILEVYDSLTD